MFVIGAITSPVPSLRAPLRLTGRVLNSLESLAEAARNLASIRSELARVSEHTAPLAELLPELRRVREQTEPVSELPPALERLREQIEPLAEMRPAIERIEEALGTRLDGVHEVVAALEGNESHLNLTVRQLVRELIALHATVSGLQDDVQRVTNRVPDPEARGPLQRAHDVLTPGGV